MKKVIREVRDEVVEKNLTMEVKEMTKKQLEEIVKVVIDDVTCEDLKFVDYYAIDEAVRIRIKDEKKYDPDYIKDLANKVLDILEEKLNELGFELYYPGTTYIDGDKYNTVPAGMLVIRKTK